MESRSHGRDWERIQALFAAAVERPAEERAAFLDRACAAEPDLRAEIQSLLTAHDHAGSFLAEPVVDTPDTAQLRARHERERGGQ